MPVMGSTINDSGDDLITYPPITEVLHEIHAVFPLLNMLQYESALLEHGVMYTNAVVHLDADFFMDIIHIPCGAVQTFSFSCSQTCLSCSEREGQSCHSGRCGDGEYIDCL